MAPILPKPTRYAATKARTAGPAEFSTPQARSIGLRVKAPVVHRKMAKYLTPTVSTVASRANPIGTSDMAMRCSLDS